MQKFILVLIFLQISLQTHHRTHIRQCPCDQQGCPSCMVSQSLKKSHENAEILNLEDADQQKIYAQSADLQNKLFSEAEMYAKECNVLETKAQELASQLQTVANKAQLARNKYLKIQSQAKQVAFKTLSTMKVHTPVFSNIRVNQVGVRKSQVINQKLKIVQNIPQYQVTISGDDLQSNIPESLEDAKFQSELSNSIAN